MCIYAWYEGLECRLYLRWRKVSEVGDIYYCRCGYFYFETRLEPPWNQHGTDGDELDNGNEPSNRDELDGRRNKGRRQRCLRQDHSCVDCWSCSRTRGHLTMHVVVPSSTETEETEQYGPGYPDCESTANVPGKFT